MTLAGSSKNLKSFRINPSSFKKTLLTLAILGQTSVAYSQDTDTTEKTKKEKEDDIEVIEIQSMRSSLLNAQSLKRNSDTFVDGITASDIGALPDRSVLEAMQRLPGVSIERFAEANDPDHFSAEGSGAVVRGMTQTRSEFNGRDTFTADSGRGLSFQDVPPELMAGVDVYKNQTADMIEGGIAGTISLRTRRPFDQAGRQLAFSADVTYGDIAQETTPSFSGLYSDRWETDNLGEFGLLLNFAKSELQTSSHGVNNDIFEFRPIEQFPNATSSYVYDGTFARYAPEGTEVGAEGVLVPTSANLSMKDDTRERTGIAAAMQWQSPDKSLKASLQFIRSDSTLSWTEKGIAYESQPNVYKAGAAPGTEFEFDERGVYTSGTITDSSGGWRGNEAGDRVPNGSVQNFGFRFNTGDRYKNQRTEVDDISLNLEWTATDSLIIEADFQHVEAQKTDDDMKLMFMTHANQMWDTTGGNPQLTLLNPWAYATEEEIATNGADYRDTDYFNELSSYHFAAAMDHYERSKGVSDAARIDATYYLDSDYFPQVQFGVRYAKREQRVKYSKYNWGSLGALWAGTTFLDDAVIGEIAESAGIESVYETVDWSDFYRGDVLTIAGGNTMLHPNHALTTQYDDWGRILRPLSEDRCGDWMPSSQRTYADAICTRKPTSGYFLPQEISDIAQTNTAAYVRIDFANDDLKYRIAGNFGVRVVKVENESRGATVFPEALTEYAAPASWDPLNYNPADYDLFSDDSRFLTQTINYLDPELRNFMNGAIVPDNAEHEYTKVLPSFNIKVELTDDLLARFAVSKAIALPDIGNLRNYTEIGLLGYNLQSDRIEGAYWDGSEGRNFELDSPFASNYTNGFDANGIPLDANGEPLPENQRINTDTIKFNGFRAASGNPYLKPMESIQWDASLEWYFNDVGSLTVSVFYKDLTNFFVNGGREYQFTNPETGVSQVVDVQGPTNGGEGEMKGFEIGYQQFFDMLPAPFDGFGIQANYTYINAKGALNANLDAVDGGEAEQEVDTDGDGVVDQIISEVKTSSDYVNGDSLPLQGQSEHTANLVLMYEKGDWSARAAYNWRSEYLVTTRDTISKLPIWTSDAGYMDASIFYQLTDQIKVGLQGVNLLNTETETFMQVDDNLRLHRAWLVNDRRYSFVVRGNF